MKDIDFALVEEKRPAMYTAMKYWGKKPHNIWGTYIENYTPQNGVVCLTENQINILSNRKVITALEKQELLDMLAS